MQRHHLLRQYVLEHPGCTAKEIVQALGLTVSQAYELLERHCEKHKVPGLVTCYFPKTVQVVEVVKQRKRQPRQSRQPKPERTDVLASVAPKFTGQWWYEFSGWPLPAT